MCGYCFRLIITGQRVYTLRYLSTLCLVLLHRDSRTPSGVRRVPYLTSLRRSIFVADTLTRNTKYRFFGYGCVLFIFSTPQLSIVHFQLLIVYITSYLVPVPPRGWILRGKAQDDRGQVKPCPYKISCIIHFSLPTGALGHFMQFFDSRTGYGIITRQRRP